MPPVDHSEPAEPQGAFAVPAQPSRPQGMARGKEKLQLYAKLVADSKAGMSRADVAAKHGVHPNTVGNALRAAGETTDSGSNAPAMEILRRLLEGTAVADIAEELSVTTQRVYAVKGAAEKAGVFKAAAKFKS